MFGKIFKGLAVAAGVGFAIGLSAGSMAASKRRRAGENPESGNSPDTGPALERLDRMESRMAAVEARPLPVAAAELDLRIQEQSKDIAALRLQMDEYRQRIANDVAVIQKGLADITKGVSALLESIVAPRVDDLRLHLRSEIQQSVNATLTTFERAIDDKVSDRIAALEKVILEQSALVTALSHRAIESDTNLERVISLVERLNDRSKASPDLHPADAQKERFFGDPPFAPQSNGADKRQAETPRENARLAFSGV